MSGMPRVCNVAGLVFMTMTHEPHNLPMWAGAGVPVTSVDIIPVTRDGVSAATVGLRTSGHGTGPRQVLLASSRQNRAGTSQGCAVTLVRTVEASIKTLWLRIRINKEVFISSKKENLIAATFY